MTPDERSWSRQYTSRNEGGDRELPYLDSKGNWTIGTGCSGVDPYCSPDPEITVNTRWTLEQRNMQFNLRHTKAEAQAIADLGLPYWSNLDGVRQAAMLDIAYQDGGGNAQTGVGGLAGYHRMLTALRTKDFTTSSLECKDSVNYRDSRARCLRNASMLQTGIRPDLTF